MKKYKTIFKNGFMQIIRVKGEPITQQRKEPKVSVEESALNGYFKKVKIEIPEVTNRSVNLERFITRFKCPILSSLNNHVNYKVVLSVCAIMTDGTKNKKYYFNSKPHVIYDFNNKNLILKLMINEILDSFNNKHFEGSGWTFKSFEHVELNYGKYTQFKGECGNNTLPVWLRLKKALVHIIADNNKCFYYCIMQHFIPSERNKGRVNKDIKKIEKEKHNQYANFDGVNYPAKAEDIERFQRQNPNIHLVIHKVADQEERTPVIFDGFPKCYNEKKEKIHLLLHEEHFYLVSDLSRLLSSQLSKGNGALHFCYKCQRSFKSENALNNHLEKCNDSVLVNLPEKGSKESIVKFRPKNKKTPSVTVYFDFESLLIPLKDKEEGNNKTHKHKPSAFSVAFISSDESIYKTETISYKMKEENEDVAEVFIKTLNEKLKEIILLFQQQKKDSDFIPIFAHNLSGYDSHLCILQLAKMKGDLHFLPASEERYISFSLYNMIGGKNREFRFLDSFKFLSSSLDNLVSATSKTRDNFKVTAETFPNLSLDILTKKGIYPYEWMDGFDKLKAQQLPDIKAFYSSLKKGGITNEEYKQAMNAWQAFKCENMGDYTLNYCLLDVVLLADVMENFRKMNIKNFKLDPFIYGFTLPGAAWHNMLKFTKVEIELITDRETYDDFKRGIRGGNVLTVKRYCRANNKYLSDYDPTKPSKFIFYIDVNNLYGQAMSSKVPYRINRKMTEEDMKNWRSIESCALVCDLEIVKENKEKMKDYPPCSERLVVDGVEKLTLNLNDKEEYIILGELLKFYIDHEMVRIKKIHRGYVFDASEWLEPYISFNTDERAKCKEESGKNYFKLCNNAMFGKFIEDTAKRSNVDLVSSEERARKLLMSPEFTGFNILSEDLVSVSRKKTMVQGNKPVFIGWYILEKSKLIMNSLFYDYLKPKFGDRVNLLYSDTDSFILEIESVDLYEEMKEERAQWFDTSNYPENHKMYSKEHKNKLGFFKDETKGAPIIAYASTSPKSYVVKTEKQENIKCKGVVGACINNREITYNDYIDCIFNDEIKTVNYQGFKNEKHQVFTEQLAKIALNPLQDVRFVLEDKIHTVPMGYFSKEEEARRREELREKKQEIKRRIKEMENNNNN